MRPSESGRDRPQTPTEAMLNCLTEASPATDWADPLAPYPKPRSGAGGSGILSGATGVYGNLSPAEPGANGAEETGDPTLELPFDLEALQAEIDGLKDEINHLRRRDETLKFYMTRLDEELRLAAKLQQEFLPRSLPQVGAVHFHTLFRPAGYVSGDLYDVMRLDEQHVGIFLVDAVGHGMPAALLTMFIKRALVCKEIIADKYHLLDPAETMQRLNDALVEQDLSHSTFCTAMYGLLDTQTLRIQLTTGGHPAPLLIRDGKLQDVDVRGALLGIFPQEKFEQTSLQLQSGDRLLIFSDGIEIAFNADMASHEGRWRSELASRATLPAEQLLTEFAGQIDQEIGSLQPKDDLTLMVVEIK